MTMRWYERLLILAAFIVACGCDREAPPANEFDGELPAIRSDALVQPRPSLVVRVDREAIRIGFHRLDTMRRKAIARRERGRLWLRELFFASPTRRKLEEAELELSRSPADVLALEDGTIPSSALRTVRDTRVVEPLAERLASAVSDNKKAARILRTAYRPELTIEAAGGVPMRTVAVVLETAQHEGYSSFQFRVDAPSSESRAVRYTIPRCTGCNRPRRRPPPDPAPCMRPEMIQASDGLYVRLNDGYRQADSDGPDMALDRPLSEETVDKVVESRGGPPPWADGVLTSTSGGCPTSQTTDWSDSPTRIRTIRRLLERLDADVLCGDSGTRTRLRPVERMAETWPYRHWLQLLAALQTVESSTIRAHPFTEWAVSAPGCESTVEVGSRRLGGDRP